MTIIRKSDQTETTAKELAMKVAAYLIGDYALTAGELSLAQYLRASVSMQDCFAEIYHEEDIEFDSMEDMIDVTQDGLSWFWKIAGEFDSLNKFHQRSIQLLVEHHMDVDWVPEKKEYYALLGPRLFELCEMLLAERTRQWDMLVTAKKKSHE